MARQVIRLARDGIGRADGLCMTGAWMAYLIQAFFADASFGVPAIVFYLHLGMITILWRASQEEKAAPFPAVGSA